MTMMNYAMQECQRQRTYSIQFNNIHDYDGVHYYSMPPQYLNYLVGSMTEHLIDKNSMTLDDDIVFEITPLSPIMSSSVRAAKGEQQNQPMERMVAIQVSKL